MSKKIACLVGVFFPSKTCIMTGLIVALTFKYVFAQPFHYRNTYLDSNHRLHHEDFIIPHSLYIKRSKIIIPSHERYIVRKNTFVMVEPQKWLPHGRVVIGEKHYQGTYQLFVTSNTSLLVQDIKSRQQKTLIMQVDDIAPHGWFHFMGPHQYSHSNQVSILPSTTLHIVCVDNVFSSSKWVLHTNESLALEEENFTKVPITFKTKNTTLTLQVSDPLNNVQTQTLHVTHDTQAPRLWIHVSLSEGIQSPSQEAYTLLSKSAEEKTFSFSQKALVFLKTEYANEDIYYLHFTKKEALLLSNFPPQTWLSWKAPLSIAHESHLYFYAKDFLGNTTPIKHLVFKKIRSMNTHMIKPH